MVTRPAEEEGVRRGKKIPEGRQDLPLLGRVLGRKGEPRRFMMKSARDRMGGKEIDIHFRSFSSMFLTLKDNWLYERR